MTTYVRCDFTQLILYLVIPSLLQIFEDGAAYRGRLKALGRDVIKIHFRAELDPVIEYDHNSSQREKIIADNITKTIEESLFLQGPLDRKVSFFVMIDQSSDAL